MNHGNVAQANQIWLKMDAKSRAGWEHSQGMQPNEEPDEVKKEIAQHYQDEMSGENNPEDAEKETPTVHHRRTEYFAGVGRAVGRAAAGSDAAEQGRAAAGLRIRDGWIEVADRVGRALDLDGPGAIASCADRCGRDSAQGNLESVLLPATHRSTRRGAGVGSGAGDG